MSVEIHFVYRNNDADGNSLENSCSSNVLEDNARRATEDTRRKSIVSIKLAGFLPLLLAEDRFVRLIEEFLIRNHRLECQHPVVGPRLHMNKSGEERFTGIDQYQFRQHIFCLFD